MKRFPIVLFLPALAAAAFLPEAVGDYHRTSTSTPTLADRPLWDEYGLKASETATYESAAGKFTATAWRLQDTTGAMAAFDWQRQATSKASAAASLASETDSSLLVVHGNYLLLFEGHKPTAVELDSVRQALPNVDTTVLPVLPSYLPSNSLTPNSERYITGPAGLQKFGPAIPPSVAGFHFGAEAQSGVFHSPKGDLTLSIFNYPTPQIAMQQATELGKLAGAVVKRSGPLVAVVLSPPDPDVAERLLSGIRYQAEVTRDEYVPTRRDNIGELLYNLFILIGILLVFSVVSGLAFGGVRAWFRRGRTGADAEAMISLHLR